MKKLFVLIISFYFIGFAQTDSNTVKVNSAIENLFAVSKKSDFREACGLIVYIGGETTKNYNAKLNSNNEADLQRAERLVKKIRAYLDISDTYDILGNKTVSKKDQEFVAVDVAFKSGNQILKMQFQFSNVNGELLLADIE